jgi:hypothetical protein
MLITNRKATKNTYRRPITYQRVFSIDQLYYVNLTNSQQPRFGDTEVNEIFSLTVELKSLHFFLKITVLNRNHDHITMNPTW